MVPVLRMAYCDSLTAACRLRRGGYAKLRHYFLRKDKQSNLSTLNGALTGALLRFVVTELLADS